MRGEEVDVHDRAVGEVRHLVEAGDRGDRRPPAHIYEDAVGFEHGTVHCDFLVRDKPGMAFVDCAAFQCFERALDASPRCPRDGVLARLDGLHVYSDRAADGHAVITRTARQKSSKGARDQRLGGRASGIDARAAEELSLDDGYLLAGSDETPRQRRPGLSCPDDDRIMIGHGLPSVSSSVYSAAIARSGIDPCRLTPSIGSNSPCHGAWLSPRIVAS